MKVTWQQNDRNRLALKHWREGDPVKAKEVAVGFAHQHRYSIEPSEEHSLTRAQLQYYHHHRGAAREPIQSGNDGYTSSLLCGSGDSVDVLCLGSTDQDNALAAGAGDSSSPPQ